MEIKTVNVTIDEKLIAAEEGMTILKAAHRFGIHIPTVCYMENLTPYGRCRICVVEISGNGTGKSVVDISCTHEVREGMVIQTCFPCIIRARKMLAELLVASAPNVKMAQDIAARMGLLKVRFPIKNNQCILCSLCIRMCYEQMDRKTLGFVGKKWAGKSPCPSRSDQIHADCAKSATLSALE